MRVRFTGRVGALGATALSIIGLGCLTPAVASAWSHKPPTLFVNGSILSGYGHNQCSTAAYTTIDEAVTAAAPGSRIVVCPGTYNEGVQIEKPLALIGLDAVIDASSSPSGNGFQIAGPGGSGSTIKGFEIEKARFEGILVGTAPLAPSAIGGKPETTVGVPVTDVKIADNTLIENGTGFGTEAGQCYSTPEAPGDCGETIHLVSVTD